MYFKVTSELGSGIREVKEYHPARYGAPGRKRNKKRYLTPEAVKRQNQRMMERRVQNLIMLNFDKGYHIVLRYPKDGAPETYEDADENLKSFRRTMSRRLGSKGAKFKFIGVTERGKRKAVLHHHIIVQNLDGINMVEEVRKAWEKRGNIAIYPMYEDGNYQKLAEYIVKAETKEEQKGKKRYHLSRGLKKPQIIEKETVYGEIPEPEAPKGWFVDPESVVTGINPYTGKKYQRYFIKNTPPRVQIIHKTEEIMETPQREMADINIYIESQVNKGQGACMYILEFIPKKHPVARTVHAMALYEGTKNSLALKALIAAVGRITKPANIKVYTSNALIKSALKNGWMQKWKDSGWKSNKGEYISHAGLWKYLSDISKDHELRSAADDDMNTYKSWMETQLKTKRKEEKRA